MLIKKGQKFQVTDNAGLGTNCNSHNYYTGVTYEAIQDDTGNGTRGKDALVAHSSWVGNTSNTIMEQNYKIILVNRDSIVKGISDLKEKHEKELAKLQVQLAYLDESKKEEYDETEFKCYQAIKSMGSNASNVEKATLISRIIKGEF